MKRNASIWHIIAMLVITALISSCNSNARHEQTDSSFFNKVDLTGWHIYNQGSVESKWIVDNDALLCDPKAPGIFGDLVSDQEYENFEMEFEWKVGKGGNSGVFINVREDTAYAAVFATGLEMQLLDNEFAEPRHQADSTHWAGCLYAVDCIGSRSEPRPYGEWNQAKIRQKDGHVTFWVNGKITFDNQIDSDDFKNKVQESNMKNYPDFGTFKKGKIAFQNHTDSVSFRNIHLHQL